MAFSPKPSLNWLLVFIPVSLESQRLIYSGLLHDVVAFITSVCITISHELLKGMDPKGLKSYIFAQAIF